MSERLQSVVFAVRLLTGLVAYFAILSGLEDWLGLYWLVAAIIAIPIVAFPIVGSILGIMGAIVGWGWDWYWAVLLFWWPIVFAVSMMFVESIRARVKLGATPTAPVERYANSWRGVRALSAEVPPANIKSITTRKANAPREVGVRLRVGIFAMPYLFSWFVLRTGYSSLARLLAFGWLGLQIFFLIISYDTLSRAYSNFREVANAIATSDATSSGVSQEQNSIPAPSIFSASRNIKTSTMSRGAPSHSGMNDDLPFQPILSGGPQLADPYDVSEGYWSATITRIEVALMNSIGGLAVRQVINKCLAIEHGGDRRLPYDDVVAFLKRRNYDVNGVPKGGWNESAIVSEMERQKNAQDAQLATAQTR